MIIRIGDKFEVRRDSSGIAVSALIGGRFHLIEHHLTRDESDKMARALGDIGSLAAGDAGPEGT